MQPRDSAGRGGVIEEEKARTVLAEHLPETCDMEDICGCVQSRYVNISTICVLLGMYTHGEQVGTQPGLMTFQDVGHTSTSVLL